MLDKALRDYLRLRASLHLKLAEAAHAASALAIRAAVLVTRDWDFSRVHPLLSSLDGQALARQTPSSLQGVAHVVDRRQVA